MCFPESVSRRGENQIFNFFEDEMKTSVRDSRTRTEDFFAKSDGVLIKNERLRAKVFFPTIIYKAERTLQNGGGYFREIS